MIGEIIGKALYKMMPSEIMLWLFAVLYKTKLCCPGSRLDSSTSVSEHVTSTHPLRLGPA